LYRTRKRECAPRNTVARGVDWAAANRLADRIALVAREAARPVEAYAAQLLALRTFVGGLPRPVPPEVKLLTRTIRLCFNDLGGESE